MSNERLLAAADTANGRLFSACATRSFISWLAISFSVLIVVARAAAAGPIDDLEPGQWYEIPDSKLRSAVMSPNPPGVDGVSGPISVIRAFSGGAYDSVRDRLIVHGGGHSDYAGNELYAFDLNSQKWLRLTDPSSMDGFSEGSATMPDGRPKSVHTYDHLEFDPISAKFFRASGATYSQGSVTATTWLFNFESNDWERQPNVPGDIYDLLHLSMASAYDPVSKKIVMLGPKASGDFDPARGQWTHHGSGEYPFLPLGLTGAIDPELRKFVAIGRGNAYIFDLDATGRMSNLRDLKATGAREVEDFDAPGLVYDPTLKKLVAWGSGSTVYSLDLQSRTWTAHQATNSVSPGNPYRDKYQGTFGRFRYVPSKNLYIVVTHIDQNVFVYKLSNTTVIPDPPKPMSPTGLTASD